MANQLKQWLNNIQEAGYQIEPHPEDEELLSSVNDVENFEETLVWRDLETLIEENIEVLHYALERKQDYEEIRRIQEQIKAWRDFLDLPDRLKQFVEMQQKAQANGRNS